MKKVIKKNIKIILGFTLGLIWSSGIAYAATILFDSDEVSYDNTTSGLSATNVQSALDEPYVESTSYQLFESRVSTLESQIYPVGSVYISTTKSTVAQVKALFGGTWEAIGQGRVLIGAGSNGTTNYSTVGATGGSETHQHIINFGFGASGNIYGVADSSKWPLYGNYSFSLNRWLWKANTYTVYADIVTTYGSYSSSSSNVPPYLVVYMYKRTA